MLYASNIFQAKEKVLRNGLLCAVYMTFRLVHPCRKHIIESVLWKRFVSITLHCVQSSQRKQSSLFVIVVVLKNAFGESTAVLLKLLLQRSLVKSLASFCIIKRLLQSMVSYQSSPVEVNIFGTKVRERGSKITARIFSSLKCLEKKSLR